MLPKMRCLAAVLDGRAAGFFHFFGRPQGPVYEKSIFRTLVKRELLAILQATFCDFSRTDYAEKRVKNTSEAAKRGSNPADFALGTASARA
jgi:hypothetical protein